MIGFSRRQRRFRPTSRRSAGVNRAYRSRRLLLETLEDRRVLATWATDIEIDTTWTNDEVQHVTADIAVAEGVTLTVEPGTMVQFAGLGLTVRGTLHAVGTETEPILFTTNRDDTGFDGVIGTADDVDTTGDGPGGPFQGAWRNIEFTSTSTGSILDHAEFRGGGSEFRGQIVVNGGELTLTNSLLRTGNAGMRIIDSSPLIADTTFDNHRFHAIGMSLSSDPQITNVTMTNNGTNGVGVDAGKLTNHNKWDDPDVAYVPGGEITVAQGVTLSVHPGQKVHFGGFGMTVDGTLHAVGTETNPILFTSSADDTGRDGVVGTEDDLNVTGGVVQGPWQGAWRNIVFNATSTGSVLDHVEVRAGGSEFSGQLLVNGGELTLKNSLIRIGHNGLQITDGDPIVTNTTFEDHGYQAIGMNLGSQPEISDVTLHNNALNGVLVDGGVLPGDTVWNNPDIVYRIIGHVTVPVDTTLTLAAGQIIKLGGLDSNITVDGTLLAEGTPSAPVIVTSTRDDSAGGDSDNNGPSGGSTPDWGQITFTGTSTGSVLDHFEARYGGGDVENAFQIFVNGGELTLTNSVIRHGTRGIRILHSDPIITNTAILNHAYLAAAMDLHSSPEFRGITTAGNQWNALWVAGGELPRDARWDNPDIVYMPSGNITVPLDTTLTIGAGQVIKMGIGGSRMIVDGTLFAEGTEEAPVIVTSTRDDSAGGDTDNNGPSGGSSRDWEQIEFTSRSTGSVLNHIELRYGGYPDYIAAPYQLYVNGGELTLNDAVIRGGMHGMRIVDSDPVINNITFLNNEFHAASMNLASNPTIRGEVIAQGNTLNALLVDPGTIPADAVWDDPAIAYLPTGLVTVPEDVTLTIEPGQVIKFYFGELQVDGRLLARGTGDQPIIFTTTLDDSALGDTNDNGPSGGYAGAWTGMSFNATSTGNVLDHVEARFGGANAQRSHIDVNGGELTLSNSLTRNATDHGVIVRGGGQLNINNTLSYDNNFGLFAVGGSTVNATNNNFDANAHGVYADTATVNLTNNLITNNRATGISLVNDATINAEFNNVFNPGVPNYQGFDDQTGISGNISVDPKYFSQPNRQYQLRGGSPVIDSGTSDGAPASDRHGNPRFDHPNVINRGAGAMPYVDLGAVRAARDLDFRCRSIGTFGYRSDQRTTGRSGDRLVDRTQRRDHVCDRAVARCGVSVC